MQGYALLYSAAGQWQRGRELRRRRVKDLLQQQQQQQQQLEQQQQQEMVTGTTTGTGTTGLPPATELSTLPDDQIVRVLNFLFEPSSTLHSLLIPLIRTHPLDTYTALATLTLHTLSSLPPSSPTLLSILSAHPRLGAKKVDSAQSQSEQKSLGSEEERDMLRRLNEEYELRFPGLRYVVFVDGRSREEVMGDMRGRIEGGDWDSEVALAGKAMCDIAMDRARKVGLE